VTLSDLWNETVADVFGHESSEVNSWRKTGFGSIGIFSAEPGMDPFAMCDLERSSSIMHGCGGDRVLLERNRCTVTLAPEHSVTDTAGGYLLLATLCCRSRHFAWTLLADVFELVRGIKVEGSSQGASAALESAAEIQRRGVIARREMRAAEYLGDPVLVALFNHSASVASVAEYDRRSLDDALEGLDRLVNGLFAVAADRSQRGLNRVGFVIAFLSLLLATTGLVDVLDAEPQQQMLVYAAGVAVAGALLSTVAVLQARRRLSAVLLKARSRRRSGRRQ
jgi:hypothetical protein